ncbi:hypothetical protein ACSBR2_034589 [Camellia fascicularis]
MDCSSSYYAHSSSLSTPVKANNGNNKKRTKPVKLSTDPQSVAARERRHRISDRFKVLQSLVPGGAKMDTVSMLEEAIHYVKFLKTQIWLHQTMIKFLKNGEFDDDPATELILPPSSVPQQQQQSVCSPEDLVVGHEVQSAVRVGFPGYGFGGEEIMGFDGSINY